MLFVLVFLLLLVDIIFVDVVVVLVLVGVVVCASVCAHSLIVGFYSSKVQSSTTFPQNFDSGFKKEKKSWLRGPSTEFVWPLPRNETKGPENPICMEKAVARTYKATSRTRP